MENKGQAYSIGQKLWFVPIARYLGEPREVEITKIGRKWLTLNNGFRADAESLVVDGGQYSPPASCHISREVFDKHMELTMAWLSFRKAVDITREVPAGVSIETISQVRKLLGV